MHCYSSAHRSTRARYKALIEVERDFAFGSNLENSMQILASCWRLDHSIDGSGIGYIGRSRRNE